MKHYLQYMFKLYTTYKNNINICLYERNKKWHFIIFLSVQKVHKNKYTVIFQSKLPNFSTHLLLWSTSFLMSSAKNVFSCIQSHVCTAFFTFSSFENWHLHNTSLSCSTIWQSYEARSGLCAGLG